MKSSKLRILIPLIVVVVVGVGFATHAGVGTLSAIGWQDIALLCPLGALSTMLASKLVVPRAVVSLVIALALIVVFGRAFCGWICPVPVVSKLRDIFKPKKHHDNEGAALTAGEDAAGASNEAAHASALAGEASSAGASASSVAQPLTAEEQALLATSCAHGSTPASEARSTRAASKARVHACASCAEKRGGIDSRHFVLGGSLLSAAIFGFPVFCLVCPIGLTFATVLLVMRMFAFGDMTWAIIVVPALLLVEVVFFRKWCHSLCPLGALMSLVGKLNRTLRPVANADTCLETTKGIHCGQCAKACPEGIDPRHLENGTALNECTKCRACIDACPSHAISMPLLASGKGKAEKAEARK